MRARWAMAAAIVAWLVSIIAPAISFDVEYSLHSDMGGQFRAYFQILCTVLFLLAWWRLKHVPLWALGGLAVLSVILFISYSFAYHGWVCDYPTVGRYVKGSDYLPKAADFIRLRGLSDAPCGEIMSNFVDPRGQDLPIWEEGGLARRFLTLFGLYSLAWLSLAVLVMGASRRALQGDD